ncbi:SGNH/GDSL hydrolase family protein [Amnibacterium sp.]|uniref:SGNH/GDSL hydrolase family protein n=1 Tax=Amnibacterium sp. TaxID=1872496 RepID=UPI0026289F0C|nr:SGNH/GDSL hydrolase family protein [Amnibacterium sp.]MCU1473936.1 family lipase [Amnibacterium sp.]
MRGTSSRLLRHEVAGVPVWLLVPVVTVIVVLVAAIALRGGRPPEPVAFRDVPVPSASSTARALPAHPRLLIFGDSYTYGSMADPLTKGYAYLVANSLGWQHRIDALPGTGYVNGGPNGLKSPYGVRLTKLIADHTFRPDVVILEGSQNDYVGVAKVRAAVDSVVRQLRHAYPGVTVVLFGPAAPQPGLNTLVAIDSQMAAAAFDMGVPYISPYEEQWFTTANTPRYGAPDGAHLSTAGHAYLAKRFLTDFRHLFGL